jgi:acetylornithine deacetylase/succinyl-diaminopimelate desuccinylase-like protein/gamma-glutamyl:cysteine ligase YbdK (ATP-grasp superfamily)
MMYNPLQFAEKYQLAFQTAINEKPQGGVAGFELEWNLLDKQFRPLLTVGSGPSQQSFVDHLRMSYLSPWMREFSQLEVFHWMIEWATRPYYALQGASYEARLMEAALINALQRSGNVFGQRLYYWHGNLLFLTAIGLHSIPGSWPIAKRRYLERCVELYGDNLATAGTHTNLSLPDPLFMWDFVHLSPTQRMSYSQGGASPQHLDEYKSEFYITATRLMRAFASLFIATSASTPLQAKMRGGRPVVILTEYDSVRNLTFPNPPTLDLPDLYRSYNDYLRLSYDLVRRGVRFGNNNWTPIRARSFAEPVERLIAVTSDQLGELYARGLYSIGEEQPAEDMARQIEIQNLMARINLPMERVEIRTDDGGHPLEVEIANLTLTHLLLLRFYADPEFARAFRYDHEDISRARHNETLAARSGLRAGIDNPLTGKPVGMREFLSWTLSQVQPLAEALELSEALKPLDEMAAGAPTTAEHIRSQLKAELGETDEVPTALLKFLAEQRENQVSRDVELIAASCLESPAETSRLCEFLQYAQDNLRGEAQLRIPFRPHPSAVIEISYPDKTSEIIALAEQLIRIPSVTASPDERLEEVQRAAGLVYDYLINHGLMVKLFNQAKYPAVLATFPGLSSAPVMLSGHFDVVPPEPDDSQFEPRLEGDYLWDRGAADMKTVVATYMVWMKDTLSRGTPYPPISLLLVGNEENGEGEPMGTPHVLRWLEDTATQDRNLLPKLLIAGERTGEKGDELWGEICTQNRGVMRFDVIAHGQRTHSGTASSPADLIDRLLTARVDIMAMLGSHLTLKSQDGWQSQLRAPFIQVGTPGIYNVTPDYGLLGMELRPIPQDNLEDIQAELARYCQAKELELKIHVMENGIICSPSNPYLTALINTVRTLSGAEPTVDRKLPATSARFAPEGQGVVWGQSGLGPHSKGERHFIPSILPYYQALQELAAQPEFR